MFLAIKEIKYLKGRYLLIISVVALIFYLVFFLTSLAYGLAKANRSAIDHFKVSGIIIDSAANNNITVSSIAQNSVEALFDHDHEPLNIALSNVYHISKSKNEKLLSVAFVGTIDDSRLVPVLLEGRQINANNEVIASISLKQDGISLNDKIRDSKTDRTYEIVGFTKEAKYNTLPVIYIRLDLISPPMQAYKNAEALSGATEDMPQRINALAVFKDDVIKLPSGLIYLPSEEVINKLPGYQAQVLTFGMMIGFLSMISAIIIGIFMYILTIQKSSSFGILKAQGFNNAYIIKAVILQTIIITFVGLLIGYLICMISIKLLPSKVPTSINYWFYLVISLLTSLFALAGSLFSVRAVTKIDPLEAIRGA